VVFLPLVDVVGAALEHEVDQARELVGGGGDGFRGTKAGLEPAEEGAERGLAVVQISLVTTCRAQAAEGVQGQGLQTLACASSWQTGHLASAIWNTDDLAGDEGFDAQHLG
jgi:hypothetical protein